GDDERAEVLADRRELSLRRSHPDRRRRHPAPLSARNAVACTELGYGTLYGIPMSSEPAPTPSPPGPRPRYTREQVFESALTLIDREDPDAFTMRRLADELGMGVMTLYGYVRNKDEMVEGVTALAFAQLHRDTPAGATWEDLVRTEIEQLYEVSRRHPHLVTLILSQRSAAPGMF